MSVTLSERGSLPYIYLLKGSYGFLQNILTACNVEDSGPDNGLS